MPRIFISYRREDSIAYAGRLHDHLSEHFGADKVFMDLGQIAPGDDFVQVLDARIRECDLVIALIGAKWLQLANEQGRRLDQADDFVRYELAAAFAQGKRVIPVLVGGATMPDVRQLPPVIARLARCQAQAVDDTRFEYDLDSLIRSIERRPSLLGQFAQLSDAERLRRWRQGSSVGIAVLMLALAWVQLLDLFAIDARIASYTMAVGDLLSRVPVDERIVIVGFDEKSEARLGSPGPAWRGEHARLVDRLVAAGAKVIAFDQFFENAGPADGELVAAIERARQRGSKVFVGLRQLRGDQPDVVPGLRDAVDALGVLCIGGRSGYSSTVPLAVLKTVGPGTTQSAAASVDGRYIALGMLAAGAETLAVDPLRRQLTVVSDRGQTLWQGPLQPIKTQFEASGEASNDCPLLVAGDQVAEQMLRLASAGTWRDPLRRYDYEQLVGPFAADKTGMLAGKTVLIGDTRPDRDEFRVLYGLRPELRHGVELHADVVNNLLQGIQVRRLGPAAQFVLLLLLAAAGGWLRIFRPATPPLARRLLALAVVLGYLALTVGIYVSHGLLFNTAYQLIAFVLAYCLLGRIVQRRALPEQAAPV
ncbi:MAG: CHASE2 domain-containing protein [Candidatus Accumulibacter sp.]|uniref:CHASE2 domain-containing protein n=1 Tax=Accumulibacter sp. TaxID=2053492 RepID=UPI0025E3B75F|nr:CHASE2 domain-containing protein [Accumulibacter sp.]MCM8597674.1 CHASE2 domain-containing protein [Accumulibacter sp.]MCM8661837.1 CHASE2 domain-containing protein [Accumulibacter sp.]